MNQEKQSGQARREQTGNKRSSTKLAYHPPQFVSYGSVAKLTRGGGISEISDSGSNMMRPP